ncbi:MAG: hypothetical protein WCP19_08725 [Chloroflexota bacterium]
MIAIGINEFSFIFLKSETARGPKLIEITIPLGTAQKINTGEKIDQIPASMIFISGDTLKITNNDTVDHRLGPMYIPSGSSASLLLGTANNFIYQCSFQNSQQFGLDVQEGVTSFTRIYGILIAGLPLGIMLGIYSIVIWPISKSRQAGNNVQ